MQPWECWVHLRAAQKAGRRPPCNRPHGTSPHRLQQIGPRRRCARCPGAAAAAKSSVAGQELGGASLLSVSTASSGLSSCSALLRAVTDQPPSPLCCAPLLPSLRMPPSSLYFGSCRRRRGRGTRGLSAATVRAAPPPPLPVAGPRRHRSPPLRPCAIAAGR